MKHHNVQRLLGRLDAGGGSGGTNSPDVLAAAMGFAGWTRGSKHRDARRRPWVQLSIRVFCLKWWPDTAVGIERTMVRDIQLVKVPVPLPRIDQPFEYLPREPRKPRDCGFVMRSEVYTETETPMSAAKRELLRTLAAWTFQKWRRRWPALPEAIVKRIATRDDFWEGFMEAVFDEFCNPTMCSVCAGEGLTRAVELDATRTKVVGIKKTLCAPCEGRGRVSRSATRRARTLTLRREDFEDHFERIYTWQLNLLRYAEDVAARALNRALDDGDFLMS